MTAAAPSRAAARPRTRRRLVDTRLGQMHVRTAGPEAAGGGAGASRPPLVLLHMSPLTGHMFDKVLPTLAADRLVIMPDRIGFGQSDRLVVPVPLAAYARATRDALDALGIAVYDVFGMHTGSCEAVAHAAAWPERVRRIGVAAVPVFTAEEIADFKAHYSAPPTLEADGSHLLRYWEWWQQAGVWWEEQGRPAWPPELRFARVRDHLLAGPNVWWTYHAVFDYPVGERVQQVRQPFLVLAPHDDLWAQTERSLPLLPAQTRIVDMPHADSEIFDLLADEVAAHLLEFFA